MPGPGGASNPPGTPCQPRRRGHKRKEDHVGGGSKPNKRPPMRQWERTIVRKQGKGHGPCKPVNEMALDSRTGEEKAGNGAVLAEPRHRFRMDARSLPTDPQGWSDRHWR